MKRSTLTIVFVTLFLTVAISTQSHACGSDPQGTPPPSPMDCGGSDPNGGGTGSGGGSPAL